MIGPRHAPVLLLSALAGALLVLVADTIARLVANPVEIPIGAITARHRRPRVLRPAPPHAGTPGRLGMTAPSGGGAARRQRARGERFRLHPTDLQIRGGAVTAVVGRNGSGKSTLLGVLSGELAPTSGTALIGGHDVQRARHPASSRDGAPC